MRVRPRVGGFPYLAESLRRAGVTTVHVLVPARTTVYVTAGGAAVDQAEPLVTGLSDAAAFDVVALTAALRCDQAGESTFDEFIAATWRAGVVGYDVDLVERTCTYRGSARTEVYVERYPAVDLPG